MSAAKEPTQAQKLTRAAVLDYYRDATPAYRLGLSSRYVWRRDDPERDAKIAAERAESAQKSAAAKARFARERAP